MTATKRLPLGTRRGGIGPGGEPKLGLAGGLMLPHSATAAAHTPHPTPHTCTHTRAVRGSLQAPGRKAGLPLEKPSAHLPPRPGSQARPSGELEPRLGLQHKAALLPAGAPGWGEGGPLGKVCGAPADYRQPTLSKNQLPENKACRDQGVEVGLLVTQCSFRQTPATTRRGHAP